MPRDQGHMLDGLCRVWLQKIRKSLDHKRKHFQDTADEAFRFFCGPHDFMYDNDRTPDMPLPSFRMSYNIMAEMVQIFGPTLYSTNPNRQVNPRPPLDLPMEVFGDPMVAAAFGQQDMQRVMFDQVRAGVMSRVLNWSPNETDLRGESRMCVDEALIKGRGTCWTEIWQPPGSKFRVIGSFYDSVDHLAIDPDADTLNQATWIARECVHPVWMIEKEYGHPPGSLRPNAQSQHETSTDPSRQREDADRKQWASNDLLRYWKVYSRMGIGGRLSDSALSNDSVPRSMDIFGDFVYMAIAEGIPYPLNLPPWLQEKKGGDGSDPSVVQEIKRAMQWPLPTWATGAWPVSCLDFHKLPKCVWPMSHFKPAAGEIKFLNWAYSFIAAKIRNVSRDFVAVLMEAADQVKTSILEGADMTMLEIEATQKRITDVVQFLQQPQFNASVWPVIQNVERLLEKRLGLNELSYGSSDKQIRSAAEADVKSQGTSVRPDDMAECVEAWMKEAARKEGLASRLYLRSDDVRPILGDIGGVFWDQFVATTDVQEAAHEWAYRIESGSMRKPNKERDAANYQAGMQILLPVYQSFAQATGNPGPFNTLVKGWCLSKGIEDYQGFLLPPPAPPPMMGPPGMGGPPGGPPGPGGPPPGLPAPR